MPRRLIEEAFPLQKVSKDSADEQEVNYGRPNGLHYWPARRPLAACRAVTIATLLPDPADAPEIIKVEYTRLSGSLLPDKQRDYLCELIESLTRWGDENGHGDWDDRDQMGAVGEQTAHRQRTYPNGIQWTSTESIGYVRWRRRHSA